jgi:hypothetical protein
VIYYSTNSMRALYQEMEYAPKRWLKNEMTVVENNILGHRENIRQWLNTKGWSFSLREVLEKELPSLLKKDSSLVQPPTLKAPTFFIKPLKTDLKTALKEILSSHPESSRALGFIEKAQLDLQSPEYYTLPLKEGFIIRGNPSASYGNLLCFAHELGHALYEVDHPGDEVDSEVAAFLLEDQIATILLSDSNERAEWAAYKSAQDQLNFFLCLNEFSEYDTGRSPIPKNYLFFRESLVTCWGYQSINAWASLQRGHWGPEGNVSN